MTFVVRGDLFEWVASQDLCRFFVCRENRKEIERQKFKDQQVNPVDSKGELGSDTVYVHFLYIYTIYLV